jgi:hypothetical protein
MGKLKSDYGQCIISDVMISIMLTTVMFAMTIKVEDMRMVTRTKNYFHKKSLVC